MVFASSAHYTSFQLLLDCADHFLILALRVRASKSFASSLAQGHRISALPLARAASSTWFGKRQNPHVRRTTSRSFGRAPEKVTRRNRRTRVTLEKGRRRGERKKWAMCELPVSSSFEARRPNAYLANRRSLVLTSYHITALLFHLLLVDERVSSALLLSRLPTDGNSCSTTRLHQTSS